MTTWLSFLACLAAIGFAGARLSRHGDILAEKTGLGGSWIGLVLLATVTSLPELASGLSAVTVAGVPDIAVGDVFGSCVFNLAILVVVDLLYRRESLYRRASRGHVLSAGFGILLIGTATFALLLEGRGESPVFGRIGAYTPLIVLLYLIAMRLLYRYERREIADFVEEVAQRHPGVSLRRAATGFALSAAVVVAAGIWLPFIGADIARQMGWHDTFVGTLLVAAATSAPELAVTIAAVRLGAIDMAVANLLGSNLFNIALLAVDDLFYADGPLLAGVSQAHALSAITAIVMTGVALIGLFYRPHGPLWRKLSWVSVLLLALYLLNGFLLYRHGG
ncbi:MAG TPA: sodium:calcium antiporter [Candidatus Desulfobacillus sp.]|nr:sodium:calcium antiporter [Candidatus Desulfobacillus sp.]